MQVESINKHMLQIHDSTQNLSGVILPFSNSLPQPLSYGNYWKEVEV